MEIAKQRKRYLTPLTLLLLLMVLVIPGTKVHAESVGWTLPLKGTNLSKTKTFQIEQGQKFYVGDFLISLECGVYVDPVSTLKSGAKYSSDNKKIASVNSEGCVTAKKVGTARITVTFRDNKYVCTVKVVSKGKLGTTTTYKKLNALAAVFTKATTGKVTAGNFLKYAEALNDYHALEAKYKKKLNCERGYILKTSKLAVPLASRLSIAERQMSMYAQEYFWDVQMKSKISGVSARAGKNTFTVKLKKTLSKLHFYLFLYANKGRDGIQVVEGKNPYILMTQSMQGELTTVYTNEEGEEEEGTKQDDVYVVYKIKPGTDKIAASLYKNKKCTKSYTLVKNMKYNLFDADLEDDSTDYFQAK